VSDNSEERVSLKNEILKYYENKRKGCEKRVTDAKINFLSQPTNI
jgi:hypothetical protein